MFQGPGLDNSTILHSVLYWPEGSHYTPYLDAGVGVMLEVAQGVCLLLVPKQRPHFYCPADLGTRSPKESDGS